jgi:hypothetical protein
LHKHQFFQKFILPGLAAFFTWGVVGHSYLTNLDTTDLVANIGQVNEIGVEYEEGLRSRYKYYPLKIKLSNYPEKFRVPDIYKIEFSYLQEKISPGDTITLYSRTLWQTILGWGKRNDIYQIDKNGQTVFFLSKVISEKKDQRIIFILFSVILWLWYITYVRIKKHSSKAAGNIGFAASGADGRNFSN